MYHNHQERYLVSEIPMYTSINDGAVSKIWNNISWSLENTNLFIGGYFGVEVVSETYWTFYNNKPNNVFTKVNDCHL